MGDAEEQLSYGKPIGDELETVPPMVPPSVTARQRIALAIDSIIDGTYKYKDIKRTLADIRQDPFIPRYLKVEAGYLLVLVEKMERMDQSQDKAAKKYDECARERTEMKKETETLKGEIEQLKYKLQKIEEIHIDIEKRRGQQ